MMSAEQFLDKLMKRAAQEGLDKAEAYMVTSKSREMYALQGEIEKADMETTAGVSFRVMVDGKLGYASTEALDDESIDMLIASAQSNARTVQSADEQFIYAPQADEKMGEVADAFVPSLADAADIAYLKEGALQIEKAALAQDAKVLRMEAASMGYGEREVRIVNTLGLARRFRKNYMQLVAVPILQDGEGMLAGEAFYVGNDETKIDTEEVARRSVARGLAALGATSVPSGSYGVVMNNEAMTSMIATFIGVFSAEEAQRGLSLLAGKEGEQIAGKNITLVDDPHLCGGYASAPFDDEGVPTYRKEIVKNGQLMTLLHNLKTAKKQNVRTTGNASKAGYAMPVSVAPSNVFLAKGDVSLDGLLTQMGKGLLITEVQGLHAGANPVTGDFSLSARGFLIEEGRIVRAINQIIVAGNFYDMLNNVVALGDDMLFNPIADGCGSPSAWIKSLSVAGS